MDSRSSTGILTLGLCHGKGGTREIAQQLRETWSRCLARNLLFKQCIGGRQGQNCEL